MTEQRQTDPAHSGSFSRALLVAAMVAVLYGAILVAIDGAISLVADRDVVVESDAGPLVGPIMAFFAVCLVFLSVLTGLRPVPGGARLPLGRALATGISVYVLSPMVGAVVYVFGQEQILSGVHFFVKYLLSPFVVAASLLAVVTILLLPAIALARSRAR